MLHQVAEKLDLNEVEAVQVIDLLRLVACRAAFQQGDQEEDYTEAAYLVATPSDVDPCAAAAVANLVSCQVEEGSLEECPYHAVEVACQDHAAENQVVHPAYQDAAADGA